MAPSSHLPPPSSQLSRIPVGAKSDPRGGGCLQVLRNLALTVQLDVPHLAHPDAEPAIECELGRHEHLHPTARPCGHAGEREVRAASGLEIVQRGAEAPAAHPDAGVRHELAALDREAEPRAGFQVSQAEIALKLKGVYRL